MRDHIPQPITNFNGLWARGDFDSCPPDHFTDCGNIVFEQTSVRARDHFGVQYGGNILMVRQQIFTTNVAGVQTVFLMQLGYNFNFYYQKISPVADVAPTFLATISHNPTDFELTNSNGVAYITFSYATVGIVRDTFAPFGILYLFNGTTFRVAGGLAPVNVNLVWVNNAGNITAGIHHFGITYETDTGFITPMLLSIPITFNGAQNLHITNIPTGPVGAGVVARRIYFTKSISSIGFADDATLYKYYYVARIPDNVTTTYDINVFDSQLIEDSTYLLTIFDLIPSGVGIGKYHNRLMVWGFPQQTFNLVISTAVAGGFPSIGKTIPLTLTASTVLFSYINNPETFSAATGFTIIDGNAVQSVIDTDGNSAQRGVTVCQEYRDLCYAFKQTKTFAFTDNGAEPATWSVTIVDEGSGAFVKGVATVLDTNGVNYEYLVISNLTGIYTFNGLFVRPELSYKVADLWKLMNKTPQSATSYTSKNNFHTVLDTINKQIYILAKFSTDANLINTNYTLLVCDFANSFIGDPNFSQASRWAKWTFDSNTFQPSTLVGYDTGKNLQLLASNAFGANNVGNTFSYEGTGTLEMLLAPFIQTHMIKDNDSNIIHLGGIRLRINTAGALSGFTGPYKLIVNAINQDSTFSKQLAQLNITNAPGKSLFLLANFSSQRFVLNVSVPNNGFFNLNDMILYIKPLYTSYKG